MTQVETISPEPPVKATKSSYSGSGFVRRLLQTREVGVLLALIVLLVAMNFLSQYFLQETNLFNMLRDMSTIGIMSIGVTMVIVTGGIDLSVGSILAAAAAMTARLIFTNSANPWVAVIIGLVFGGILGLGNALVITRLKVNPFITTLGMMNVARGITYLLSTGLQGTVASNIPMRDAAVNFMGEGYIGPVPFQVIEMIALVILFSLFLRYTVLGRQIYAVGSNEAAARLSGVRVDRVKFFVYMLTGIMAALAGILTAGLLGTAQTSAGTGAELSVIAAVVIGGASLSGGEGSILGAIIGAAIMAVVRNAFVLLHFPIYAQTITIGVVIVIAVATDQLRRRQG